MNDRQSGRIDMRATLIQPFHHGAGSAGNTALLRTKPVIDPSTCERHDVPYLSGNSVRHMLRAGAAWHAIRTAGLDDGTLSKEAVHLLLSGGALTKSGAAVDLAQARKLGELVPGLALLGFSAGNTMQAGKLLVSDLDLVCRENAWRAPPDVRDDPRLTSPFGTWIEDVMGTRHDPMGAPAVRALMPADTQTELDFAASAKLAKSRASERVERGDSLQMIYEHQVVVTGAGFYGDVHYRELTPMERAALVAALSWSCAGEQDASYLFHFGARSSHAWGRAAVRFSGVRIGVPLETRESVPVAPNQRPPEMIEYEDHLRTRRDEIRAALLAAA